jgi:hypothetical protein
VIGLFRYHAALLLRSYRWIAPMLFFGVLAGSATSGGPAPAEAFGFAGAILVPTCAWLVRLVVTGEPEEARACVGAAGGTARAQLAALGVAVAGGAVPALLSAPVMLFVGVRVSTPDRPLPPRGDVFVAGLLGELACVLIGVAVGALCNPPVVRGPAVAVLATGLLVVVSLVAGQSPAIAAIKAMVAGNHGRVIHPPLVALGWAGLVAALAVTVSVLVARSRGVD